MNKKPLSAKLKALYGLGDFFTDMSSSLKTYYWNIFLTSIAKLPLASISVLNGIMSVSGFIMTPLYGAVLDGIKPMKWGRYRSILLVMTPIAAALTASTWFVAGIPNVSVALPLLIIISIVYALFFNLHFTANVALIPVVCSTEQERATLSSRRWAWINFNKVVLGYVVTFLMGVLVVFGIQKETVASYGGVAIILAITCTLGMWLHFALTKGYEGPEAETGADANAPAPKAQRVSLGVMLSTVFKNPPLLALFCAQCGTSTVSFILAMMAAYEFNLALEAPAMLALYLAITNIGATIGSVLAGVLNKKFEAKYLSMGCLALCVIFMICARLFVSNAIMFTIFILCERTASSCNFPTFMTMYTNCSIYAEHKTGTNSAGVAMSISNIPVLVATTITGQLIPAVLAATGYDPNAAVVPQAVKDGLSNAITLIPVGCYVWAFLIITFFFKLRSADVLRMQQEIDARKASQNN